MKKSNEPFKAAPTTPVKKTAKLAAQNKVETVLERVPIDVDEDYAPFKATPAKKLTADEQEFADKMDNAFFGDNKANVQTPAVNADTENEEPIEAPIEKPVVKKEDNRKY